jgi:hypothetical protein
MATSYTTSDLCLGGTVTGCDLHAPPSGVFGLLPPLSAACFLVFLLVCVCVILLFLWSQTACV